jgi:hypothetical protein
MRVPVSHLTLTHDELKTRHGDFQFAGQSLFKA